MCCCCATVKTAILYICVFNSCEDALLMGSASVVVVYIVVHDCACMYGCTMFSECSLYI